MSFARRFGEINVNRFFKAVDGYPMIAEVRKEPDQTGNIGGGWHTDHTYDQAPAMGSILYAREVPETGGDTYTTPSGHTVSVSDTRSGSSTSRPRRPGPPSDPEDPWRTAKGVKPVIEAGPEPYHDPGPGVIGIDR